MLPRIRYSDGIRRRGQAEFRGINRNPFAGDGVIYDCMNMSARYYPAVSTRPYRYKIVLDGKFVYENKVYNGAFNHVYENYVFTVAFSAPGSDDPAALFRTDLSAAAPAPEYLSDLANSNWVHNTFTVMNNYLVIFPAGAVYNMVTGELRYIDEVYMAPAGTIRYSNGTLYDIETAANTVTTTGESFPFNVGDCVVFEGARYNDGVVAVIQEMNDDKTVMRFYENTFTWNQSFSGGQTEDQSITISRKRPEGLEFVMCVNNRLWACGGKHIAASADGDPFNWNTFEGTDADSWQMDILGEGDFTGCVNYGGTPIFFKPNTLIKVYGDYPSAYTTSETSCRGVKSGAEGSLAEVGGYLFWLSDSGVMYYSGGLPRPIGTELGKIEKKYGVGGSDGQRYYLCLRDGSGGSGELYTFDTESGFWYKEDNMFVYSFSGSTVVWATDNYGNLISMGDPASHLIPDIAEKEADFASAVTFTDFAWDTADRKYPSQIQLRFRIADGATVTVKIRYDSEEKFTAVPMGEITGDGIMGSRCIPVEPRRCDHFTLKIEGVGEWQLLSMEIESAVGSGK